MVALTFEPAFSRSDEEEFRGRDEVGKAFFFEGGPSSPSSNFLFAFFFALPVLAMVRSLVSFVFAAAASLAAFFAFLAAFSSGVRCTFFFAFCGEG